MEKIDFSRVDPKIKEELDKEWNLYFWYRFYLAPPFSYSEVSKEEKRYKSGKLVVVIIDNKEMLIFKLDEAPTLVDLGNVERCLFPLLSPFYFSLQEKTRKSFSFDTFIKKVFMTEKCKKDCNIQSLDLKAEVKKLWYFSHHSFFTLRIHTDKFQIVIEGNEKRMHVPEKTILSSSSTSFNHSHVLEIK